MSSEAAGGLNKKSSEANEQPAKEASPAPKASSLGLGEALFGVKPAVGTGNGAVAPTNPFASSNPFAPKAQPSSASSPAAASNPFAPSKTASPSAPAAESKSDENGELAKDMSQSFAAALKLNNTQRAHGLPPPPEPWPEESQQPEPYPVRWLSDAEYETLDPTPLPRVPAAAAASMDIDSSEGGSGGAGKEDKEVFESTMDATFQKFADRIGQNPEQCIRYEFAGQPLLYSKSDAVGALLHAGAESNAKVTSSGSKGMPRCGNCGAGRVFEVQLTPHAIEELEIDEDGLDGIDWGTVIVGVCEKDCQQKSVAVGEAGYIEEWVGVQWEELTVKR